METLWGFRAQPPQIEQAPLTPKQTAPCRFHHRWKDALQHGVLVCLDCGIHAHCPECTGVAPWDTRIGKIIRRCLQHQTEGNV